ncbi:MAG: hypothetical protein D6719_03850 [Candidatus Dadabacteria bacterium]|nr:MAG: hypothetical protein D6719_03850 [Candidatus Dadabacteria bacterium]
MKLSLKKCLVLLFATLVIAISSGYDYYALILSETIVEKARTRGLVIHFKHPSLGLMNFKADRMTINLPQMPVSLPLKNPLIKPVWSELITLTPAASLTATLYGGNLHGLAVYRKDGGIIIPTISLSNCQMNLVPQFAGFGVTEGNISLKAEKLVLENSKLRSGELNIKVANARKASNSSLPSLLTGLPFDLQLPPFRDLNLDCKAGLTNAGKLQLNCVLVSSLADVSASGSINTASSNGELRFKVNLKPDGQKYAGSYLPIISSGVLSTTDSIFSVLLNGSIYSPRISWKK